MVVSYKKLWKILIDDGTYQCLFNATIAQGEPRKLEHNDIKWITPSEIRDYEFRPADYEILKEIIKRYE